LLSPNLVDTSLLFLARAALRLDLLLLLATLRVA
jgi:hypothetical protein